MTKKCPNCDGEVTRRGATFCSRKCVWEGRAKPNPRKNHGTCHHATYRLTCGEFERLLARAQEKCEICGSQPPQLWIDHDHAVGWHGVRGLVCGKCNAHMRRIDAGERTPDEAAARFIANPWHLTRKPNPKDTP